MVFSPFTIQIFTDCSDFNLPQRLESVAPLFVPLRETFFSFSRRERRAAEFLRTLPSGTVKYCNPQSLRRLRHKRADDEGFVVPFMLSFPIKDLSGPAHHIKCSFLAPPKISPHSWFENGEYTPIRAFTMQSRRRSMQVLSHTNSPIITFRSSAIFLTSSCCSECV